MPGETQIARPFVNRDHLTFKGATTFRLVVESLSSVTTPVFITGATKDGPFSIQVSSSSGGTLQTSNHGIPDIPIWVSVITLLSTTDQGELWVKVSLQINATPMYSLCSGYVTSVNWLSWPAVNLISPEPQRGRMSRLIGSNPAAGSEIVETVPANQIWLFKSFRASLVTDANVATRQVHLAITSSGTPYVQQAAATTQAASLTKNYSFAPNLGPSTGGTGNEICTSITGGILLLANDTIETITTNFQVGDNWGSPMYGLERFLVP